MANWDIKDLEYWDAAIREHVDDFGLDCYEQEFEVCDHGHVKTGGRRDLGEEHGAEFTGANEPHPNRSGATFQTLLQQMHQAHG